MGVGLTARPKQSKKGGPTGPEPTAFTIKGSLEWRARVERGADHRRTGLAKLVDGALVDSLRSHGFQGPSRR
jgi:hypothetical protein